MAESRRRAGYLRETILQVLHAARQPLSALELRQIFHRQGDPIGPNLIFRGIRQLVDRGAIRKVLVARGYAPGSGEREITLFCRQCGKVTEIACDGAFDSLDDIAARRGFTVSRHIVEVPGLCGSCAIDAPGDGAPTPAMRN
jgi:Fe2+ or Zn2+ uptake regulation protein